MGLAILIDEAQDLSHDELATMSTIAHAAAQESWPVLFAFAGLPSLPRILAEARSYAERFQYLRIVAAHQNSGLPPRPGRVGIAYRVHPTPPPVANSTSV